MFRHLFRSSIPDAAIKKLNKLANDIKGDLKARIPINNLEPEKEMLENINKMVDELVKKIDDSNKRAADCKQSVEKLATEMRNVCDQHEIKKSYDAKIKADIFADTYKQIVIDHNKLVDLHIKNHQELSKSIKDTNDKKEGYEKRIRKDLNDEVNRIADAVEKGDIRISGNETEGFADVIKGLNRILNVLKKEGFHHKSACNTSGQYAGILAEFAAGNPNAPTTGNLDKLSDEAKNHFNNMNKSLEQIKSRFLSLSADAKIIADASEQAKLNVKIDESKYSGIYAEIAKGMNRNIPAFSRFVNSIPCPVFVIDKDFVIISANNAFANLVGHTEQKIIGTKCFCYIKSDKCHQGKCSYDKCINQENVKITDFLGADHDYAYNGIPLKDGQNTIRGKMIFLTDLSKMRNVENLTSKETDRIIENLNKLSEGIFNVKQTTINEPCAIIGNFGRIDNAMKTATETIRNLMNDVSQTSERISNGDISQKMTADYKGEFKIVKDKVNQLIDAMNEALSQAHEIVSGNLTIKPKKISQYLEDIMKLFSDIIMNIRKLEQKISSSAGQINADVKKLSDQQQSLEDVKKEMENMKNIMTQHTDIIDKSIDNLKDIIQKHSASIKNIDSVNKSISERAGELKQLVENIRI